MNSSFTLYDDLVLVIFAFIVLTLASARVTRLIYHDRITFGIRQKLARKLGPQHWFVYLIHCPYCTSVWVCLSASAFGVLVTGISWWWFLPAALAMSHLVAPILQKHWGD